MKRLLFMGAGKPEKLFPYFSGWKVERAQITEISKVRGEYDAAFASCALNELPYSEVPDAISAIGSVLASKGFLLSSSPSLEWVFEQFQEIKEVKEACAHLYGPQSFGAKDGPFYKSGFTQEILREAFASSSMKVFKTMRSDKAVFGIACKGLGATEADNLIHELFRMKH